MSTTTVASGLLTLGFLAATVKCHVDMKKKMMSEPEDKMKPMKNIKYALMLGTVVSAGVFLALVYKAKQGSSSFMPSSSMAHTESEAEFARRVSAAASKLRSQINRPVTPAPGRSASELAAMASAEISSFIANNV